MEFINSPLRNQWLQFQHIDVYVRKAHRLIEDRQRIDTLDIANIVVEEGHQGKGIFTAFLKDAEDIASEVNRKVYIESILEPRLITFLNNRGYRYLKYPIEDHNMVQY